MGAGAERLPYPSLRFGIDKARLFSTQAGGTSVFLQSPQAADWVDSGAPVRDRVDAGGPPLSKVRRKPYVNVRWHVWAARALLLD